MSVFDPYKYLILVFDMYISNFGFDELYLFISDFHVRPVYIGLWCLTYIYQIMVFDLYMSDFGV